MVSDAMSVIETLGATLFDYKSKMGTTAISQCQENEIRERHNWAMTNLNKAGQVEIPIDLMADYSLTLSQTTNLRLFQTERVCRRQF